MRTEERAARAGVNVRTLRYDKRRIYRSEEGQSPLPLAGWIRAALGRTHG